MVPRRPQHPLVWSHGLLGSGVEEVQQRNSFATTSPINFIVLPLLLLHFSSRWPHHPPFHHRGGGTIRGEELAVDERKDDLRLDWTI